MLNHITLRVRDLEESKKFFGAILTPLGYKLFIEKSESAGFGQSDVEGNRDFWIKKGEVAETKSFSCLAFTASINKSLIIFIKEH